MQYIYILYSTLLHVVPTSELTKDTSFLDYDFKDFGLYGESPKHDMTSNDVGSYWNNILDERGVSRFRSFQLF
jgi:hypothetical protein